MAPQPPSNVGENDVSVIELDRKRRAREYLLYAPLCLERGFLNGLDGLGLGRPGTLSTFSISKSD